MPQIHIRRGNGETRDWAENMEMSSFWPILNEIHDSIIQGEESYLYIQSWWVPASLYPGGWSSGFDVAV